MACPLYDEIRLTFLEETERALQAPAHGRRLRVWRQGADGSRFDIVMSLDDKGHIGRLARYLDQAWQSRAAFIAVHLAGANVADVDLDGSDSVSV
jgi:hypothetical protein